MFVGTVTNIENAPDERRGADQSGTARYHFQVEENINGVNVKEMEVYSGRGGGDCSYHFQLGQKYFVDPYEENGQFFAVICSETQPAADAIALLSELRARRDGKQHASLFGVLRKTQQPYASVMSADYDRPLSGITVELRGSDRKFSSQTDANGVYRLYGLPADTYHFTAILPAELELGQTILSEPQPPITIPENACYQQDLEALPLGRIRGRVLNPDSVPLKYADVELFREDLYKEGERGWWEFQGEKDGHFEFDHLAPGKYIIVFHNSNRSDPNIPYARTFYPAAPDLKSATPITIEEGQQFLNADIHVSGGHPTRELTLRLCWNANPTPEDVYFSVLGSDGSRAIAMKLSPGVFRVTILHDIHYTIYAYQDCGLRWEGDTGTPIGARETDRIEVDGSDSRTTDATVSLQDTECKPYQRHNK
jgi:hypothetical protein